MSCPVPVGLLQVAATAGLYSQAAGGHPIVLTKVAEIVAYGLRVGGDPVLVVGFRDPLPGVAATAVPGWRADRPASADD